MVKVVIFVLAKANNLRSDRTSVCLGNSSQFQVIDKKGENCEKRINECENLRSYRTSVCLGNSA